MKYVYLLFQLITLYFFYLTGCWIQDKLGLYIPGSIIGMLLMLGLLLSNILKKELVDRGSELLIRYLPLLFLPVTVGIINYFGLFMGKGIILFIIVLISTIFVMISSGFASLWVWKKWGYKHD